MARRTHHEEAEEHDAGMERWLLTYADMITLLLALFIVLFALSTISTKKFEVLAVSLKSAFSGRGTVTKNDTGLLQHNSLVDRPGNVSGIHQVASAPGLPTHGSTSPPTTAMPPAPPGSQSLAAIQDQLNAAMAGQGLSSDVQISRAAPTPTTQELVVQILSDTVFYAVDSADLGPVGDRVVDAIATVLRTDTNNAAVQGYTDDQPISGGPYATNWELSAERAVHVVVRLTHVDGIDPNRLAAVGYGHTRPLVPNDTPAHQAQNRRVDVVVLAPGESQP
ncbi:MAG TPA: flagellar motor protein MotB [Acidimicrobiales bacterium]|nr:flagellar motor protein MotB [Acidimicrobiales bacterium]